MEGEERMGCKVGRKEGEERQLREGTEGEIQEGR